MNKKEKIMHKKYSSTQLRNMLSDILCLAFEHMEILAREVKKLNFTEENMSERTKEDLDRAQMLSHVLTVINDIIHPAHDTAMEMFPQSKGFIEYCMNNQKMAIEKKLINPQCNCHSCKSKAPIGK